MGRIPFAYQEEAPYNVLLEHSSWRDLILDDFRSIPFALTCISLGWQITHLLVFFLSSLARRAEETHLEFDEDAEGEPQPTGQSSFRERLTKHIAYLGGDTIFNFMLARFVGGISLLWLSSRTAQNTCESLSFDKCPETFLTGTFLYSSFAGLVALVSKGLSVSATRLNIVVLLSAFTVYLYRDIWPLATYTEQPADLEEGNVLFVKMGILAIISVFIPLFIPRKYVPVDPKNPMSAPNPEQTASIISILTYTYLNPVIFLGYKVPHLSYERLPPLSDYDSAGYQMARAFPYLDVFAGSKQRHLFLRLLRVFRMDYTILLICLLVYSFASFISPIGIYKILSYLETSGKGQSTKPWIWIVWLFFGPTIQSICLQFYILIANRVAALTELVVTQLVFEHSLRIRFKSETSNSPGSRPTTPPRTETPVSSTGTESAEGSNDPDAENSSLADKPNMSDLATPNTSTSTSNLTRKTNTQKNAAEPPNEKDNPPTSGGNLVGKINNLVTTDLNNITSARDFLFLIIGVPLNVILCLIFLYRILGWSTFVGFGVMLVLVPVPRYIAKKIQEAQEQKMRITDARVQAVSETMSIIRMVKLFGWEDRIAERLRSKREEELKLLWKIQLLNCASSMVGFIFPALTMLSTYGLYTLVMKGELTPSIVFPSMAVFSALRTQVYRTMQFTVTLLQGKVSLDRLSEFLHKTELLDSFLSKKDNTNISTSQEGDSNKIGFKDTTFSWSINEEDISGPATPSSRIYRLFIEGELLFKRNAINLIIGPTGSGKTSMLMALLGEMHLISSSPGSWFNLPRKGGVAYAAQESWVLNDTIRNNILFGSQYNEERYQKVIKQCALEHDLELFDAGDATEVGERGLTLSGGQKARITLARAIYSPAEILLLDDVLAALDVHTSAWIVEKCFRGDLVKNRTILLVTHNIALASSVAVFTVSIGMNGKLNSQGNDIALALSRDPKLASEIKVEEAVTTSDQDAGELPTVTKSVKDGKLTVPEELVEGHVTWKSFKLLLTSLGGDYPSLFFSVLISSLLLNEWSYTLSIWFVGYWGSQYETRPASEVPVYHYLAGYSGIMILFSAFFIISYLAFAHGSIRAARVISSKLFDSILGSTLRWLDETPVGRIVTRCTQDISAVDGPIPLSLVWITDCASGIITKLGTIVLFSPIFIWPGFTIAFIALFLGNMYLKAQLSVKRETSNARAPMLSHFSAAIHGLTSIRAYGAQDRFKSELMDRINHYTRVSRMSYDLGRWISFRIDLLGACYTAALATYLIYGPRVGTSNTGFLLNMALDFTTLILFFVRMYNDFEVQANSLERIQGYIDIEHEPKPTEEGKPSAAWPTSGDLRVENLTARYSLTGPEVLRGLSFHLASGQRVGVVGRTGSGKSSLTLALLRCILTEGDVYLDGVLTSRINLNALRTSISIIPQTPELLSGTLRENLDPFNQNDDAVLNDALDSAGLFLLQEEAGEASLSLDTNIASGGGNLSVGQRQIVALARAMIRGSKLLMLDEATSSIDYKTDAVIQRTLRTQLSKDVTVLTVAHRLQTIMDSDKIMVLDNGRITEFGKPSELLLNETGMLRALVEESDDKERLFELAGMR